MEFETLKKDNRKKWIIGVIAIIAIASTIFFVSTRANYKTTQRLNLINSTINWSHTDLNIIAIKVQNASGTYETSNTVPTSGYTLSSESYCEVNGNPDSSIPMEYKDGKVNIGITQKGTKCYLFFDKITASEMLIAKNEMVHETFTSDDGQLIDTGYRYEGANPKNYVTFNNELWRIIGVFDVENGDTNLTESLVKIIRNESIGDIAWNTKYGNTDWSNASLQKLLNEGDYYNPSGDYSGIGLTGDAKNIIENVLWYIGEWDTNVINTDIQSIYNFERGGNIHTTSPSTFPGKVGLMYVSDYGYASSESMCPRNTIYYNYNSANCYGNNWLYINSRQWILSPIGISDMTFIEPNGTIASPGGYTANYTSNKHTVRPAVYLKSNVQIVDNGKDGSYDHPYDLVLN